MKTYKGKAYYWWSRACGYHRGIMPDHDCKNPTACLRVIRRAEDIDGSGL